jgi:hypothetical protein
MANTVEIAEAKVAFLIFPLEVDSGEPCRAWTSQIKVVVQLKSFVIRRQSRLAICRT